MKNFEKLLQEELAKLPYTKHVDDGQFNDGFLSGFEQGARWCEKQVESLSFMDICFIVFILLFSFWVLLTLTSWLLFNFDNDSLIQILKNQWHWVNGLKIF